ncbi:MAG: 3-isopropylmalate dehydratase small subunit [Dethiobacteria bacterium]|nr:3-isopropylmalate dehydratase small subunit [Bacillota bacterium]MDW7729059.1 3-isopropylmalate dehydratase small subunit [Bacillota bacterium]
MILEGNIWIFGDNIDTDAIIAARYLSTTAAEELASHLMEDIRPDFPELVKKGDIIIAGNNFGCGSSREHAPLAIKGAGVSCVIARSFARIFYRNSINIGLPILECADDLSFLLSGQDRLQVNLEEGLITHLQSGRSFKAAPFPPFMQELIRQGGLVEYVKARLNKKVS